MSGRSSDADGVSVNEKKAGYSGSTSGPLDDTEVHSRETPMPVEWTLADPVKGQPGAGPVLPDLRKSLRTADDVERDRPRDLPGWIPYAVAAFVTLMILGGATAILIKSVQSRAETTIPTQAPVEELEGVPVRRGLNQE